MHQTDHSTDTAHALFSCVCAINVHALDTRYAVWIQTVSTAMTNYWIAYIGIDIVVVIVV